MNVRPATHPRVQDAVLPWTQSVTPGASDHAGLLDGATVTGEAARRHLSVRIGLWLDDGGLVRQARWRAGKETALREYAEAACRLLESGTCPGRVDGAALRAAVAGADQVHLAELVANAVSAAAQLSPARS